jgi:hypothetical protein
MQDLHFREFYLENGPGIVFFCEDVKKILIQNGKVNPAKWKLSIKDALFKFV